MLGAIVRKAPRARANRALLAEVRRLHAEHHGRYGSPGMHAALRAEGATASRGAPNPLNHELVASAPNRVWLADIICIAIGEGWLYLAAVLDLATRRFATWSSWRPTSPFAASVASEELV